MAQEALDHLADGPVWITGRAANATEIDRRAAARDRGRLVAQLAGP